MNEKVEGRKVASEDVTVSFLSWEDGGLEGIPEVTRAGNVTAANSNL